MDLSTLPADLVRRLRRETLDLAGKQERDLAMLDVGVSDHLAQEWQNRECDAVLISRKSRGKAVHECVVWQRADTPGRARRFDAMIRGGDGTWLPMGSALLRRELCVFLKRGTIQYRFIKRTNGKLSSVVYANTDDETDLHAKFLSLFPSV